MVTSRKFGFDWQIHAAALAVALTLGCGPGGPESDGAPETTAKSAAPTEAPAAGAESPAPGGAAAEAANIFATRCFTCHGLAGKGDGPGSAGLSPAPRNLQDPTWQDSVDDDHIANIIMYGGSAVGRSPTMPSNPDLSAKPDVVAALVAHVRGLRSK